LLQGIVARADEERQRPENDSTKTDFAALQRGVDAVREILRRRKTESIDPQLAGTDALLLGFFLQRLSRPAEAAEAMLDYVETFGPADANNASVVLDNAQAIIGKLRADAATADLPDTVHVYDRFLPIAIKQFARKEFAYEYARRLQLTGHPREAIEYFRQVPLDDKR